VFISLAAPSLPSWLQGARIDPLISIKDGAASHAPCAMGCNQLRLDAGLAQNDEASMIEAGRGR
jgi:hypothetical protein